MRCVRHAVDSDIRSLSPLPRLSLGQSRLVTRAMIAWLHVIQPLARARGRLRGILSSPEVELAHDHHGPVPEWHQIAGVLSALATRCRSLTFWSESWLAREALLTRIVERLRSTRVATALEIDGPWELSRDISLQLGQWGRVDVQLLVEEHERGRVLVRIARRLRVTPFFAASLAALVALAVVDAAASAWLLTVPVVVVLAMMARAAWHAAVTVAFADEVMTRALQDAGALPIPAVARSVSSSDPVQAPPPIPATVSSEPSRSVATVSHAN
jgi:hypothetical protein